MSYPETENKGVKKQNEKSKKPTGRPSENEQNEYSF